MTHFYRQFQSVEALNSEYMVGATSSVLPTYIPRFAAASERITQRADVSLGVGYGLTTDEYLDIVPPSDGGAGPHPVFIFIHGGYWRAHTARDFAFAAAGPGSHGMITVIPNYSLAPQVPLSEITRQMRAATLWVARHIASYGGDPGRIVVGGHSAGGHLSAMIALTDWARYGLAASPVHAVHTISGVFDLRPLPHTVLAPWLQLSQLDVLRQSPMLHDLPDVLPPFDISYGLNETAEFQRQSRDFADRLVDAGHSATLLPLTDANHFDAVLELDDPASLLTRHIAQMAESRVPADLYGD